jgi:uncharacterized protein YjbJ (UPF0337 family)
MNAGRHRYFAGRRAKGVREKRNLMGLDDKIKKAAQDVAGKAKEALGDHKNDDNLRAEGQKDQTAASTKKVGEDVKDVFK